jgi:hypothetical protein
VGLTEVDPETVVRALPSPALLALLLLVEETPEDKRERLLEDSEESPESSAAGRLPNDFNALKAAYPFLPRPFPGGNLMPPSSLSPRSSLSSASDAGVSSVSP